MDKWTVEWFACKVKLLNFHAYKLIIIFQLAGNCCFSARVFLSCSQFAADAPHISQFLRNPPNEYGRSSPPPKLKARKLHKMWESFHWITTNNHVIIWLKGLFRSQYYYISFQMNVFRRIESITNLTNCSESVYVYWKVHGSEDFIKYTHIVNVILDFCSYKLDMCHPTQHGDTAYGMENCIKEDFFNENSMEWKRSMEPWSDQSSWRQSTIWWLIQW